MGRRLSTHHLKFDPQSEDAISLFKCERGGDVTYHCPGQIVVYPLIDLTHFKRDLHWFMRQLEEVTLRAKNGTRITLCSRISHGKTKRTSDFSCLFSPTANSFENFRFDKSNTRFCGICSIIPALGPFKFYRCYFTRASSNAGAKRENRPSFGFSRFSFSRFFSPVLQGSS